MERQVLVISFVGEKPTPEAAGEAVVALQRFGTYIDTTVQPTMCILNEKEQAAAMMLYANKSAQRGEGITVKVNNPNPIINATKAKKIVEILTQVLNDE